jgi:hypothetical protein
MVGAAMRFQCGQYIDAKPFRVAFAVLAAAMIFVTTRFVRGSSVRPAS